MKISQLIKILSKVKKKQGDLDLYVYSNLKLVSLKDVLYTYVEDNTPSLLINNISSEETDSFNTKIIVLTNKEEV